MSDAKQGIENLRNGVAGAIDQVSAALTQVSTAVFDARFPLAQLRGYVQSANQVILPFLQAFTPIFFLFVGAIFTILYGWTAFVMWKFFQWANAWRKGASAYFDACAGRGCRDRSAPFHLRGKPAGREEVTRRSIEPPSSYQLLGGFLLYAPAAS